MVILSGMPHAQAKPAENRINILMRTRYDSALTLLKPLLNKPDSLNGASLYRAISQLQKTNPDLSGNEIEALVTSVIRTLQHRGDKH
jgi:hypothetical protein